jgi:alpha-L-fucosidase
MLHTASRSAGNLLLNIGPSPDGSVPDDAIGPLTAVGKWLKLNGEAVYGKVDRCDIGWGTACGSFSRKGKTLYFWCKCWPGQEMNIGGFQTELKSARFLASGKRIAFKQVANRIILKNMPASSPDKLTGYNVIALEFAKPPMHKEWTETPALTAG